MAYNIKSLLQEAFGCSGVIDHLVPVHQKYCSETIDHAKTLTRRINDTSHIQLSYNE